MKGILSILFLLFFVVGCNNPTIPEEDIDHTTLDTLRYPNSVIVKGLGKFVNGKKQGLWKFFNQAGELDTVRYYDSNKIIAVLDKEDFDLVPYTNRGIEIFIPSKWSIKKKLNTSVLLLCATKDYIYDTLTKHDTIGETHTYRPPTILLIKDTTEKSMSSEEFFLNMAKEVPKKDSLHLLYHRWLIVNNVKAYQSFYFITIGEEQSCFLTTIFQDGTTFYVITESALTNKQEYIKYTDLFEKIAETFQILSVN
ncbi:MAG TPA: hypothetical protein VN922_02900 [Bacteroidia bacterium]|nr:hypothetical protein [Bacteroidia bacterium]